MVQLSHQYITTGKNADLTIRTFVRKVMSLLLNTLYRFFRVLLSSLQPSSAVILKPKKIKSAFPPSIGNEEMVEKGMSNHFSILSLRNP